MYLGDTFDIHTGGIDHLPVHHPNEMAQSFAATGKLQAKVWLHNEFIRFQEGKMSKSAGTFITLDNLKEKSFSPLALRYFVLQTHYKKGMNFSWEALEAAQNGLVNIIREITGIKPGKKVNKNYLEKFYTSMADDLNTPQALAVLQEVLADPMEDSEKLATVYKMDEVLGLNLKFLVKNALNLSKTEKDLLKQRQTARDNKDWKKSDQLRDELKALGIEVEDSKDGQKAVKINL
jgi:cysteinyl-tRNA synthetase